MTLPNGIWNGSLIWSQCDDAILLHALPTTDCSNLIECDMYSHIDMHHHTAHVDSSHGHHNYPQHTTSYGAETSASAGAIDDIVAEDYDYAVDCGDFIF